MRAVVTRVTEASVTIDGKINGQIGKGFLVLLGIAPGDTEETAVRLADRVCGVRVFEDENGKMNLSLKDVGGKLLIVSQFTLYADCQKGNRPSFVDAASPDKANKLYEYFKEKCKAEVKHVGCGIFGADMKVSLLNDGPVTIILEK